MDLLSKETIKELLLPQNVGPSKLMGQHFLISQKALHEAVEAAQLTKDDTILEVGPGIGTLTTALAPLVKKVIAVEKDRSMIEILKKTLKDFANVEVIHQDILTYQLPEKEYKVVANIPYYLTSALIRTLLESNNPPQTMVLMIQKEVAQRICQKPPRMSLLAVSVQCYAKAETVYQVPREQFWPKPKVDSAIIKIVPELKNDQLDRKTFFAVVKAGFSAPRKQLVNNLATLKRSNGVTLDKMQVQIWMKENNIEPNQRAQTLSIGDWIKLANSFKKTYGETV